MVSAGWRCRVCPRMEIIMRADLAAQLGLAIDLAAINGAGSGTVPRGILQTSGIGSDTNRNEWRRADLSATSLTWRPPSRSTNAATGSLGYLTNTKVRGQLKKTEMFDGTKRKPGVAERRNAAERLSRWCDESGAC